MKLFLILGVLLGGYAYSLLLSTDLAVSSVKGMYAQTQHVERVADQWQQGNTAVSLR